MLLSRDCYCKSTTGEENISSGHCVLTLSHQWHTRPLWTTQTFVYKADPGNITWNHRIAKVGRDWSSSSPNHLAQWAVSQNRLLRTLSGLVLNISNDEDFKSLHNQLHFRSNGLVFRIVLIPHKPGDEEHTTSEGRTTIWLADVLFIFF